MRIHLLAVTTLLASLTACQQNKTMTDTAAAGGPNYARPLPSGTSPLRKVVNPERLTAIDSAWNQRDLFLRDAADESITWFDKPSTLQWYPTCDIDHARARASVVAFRDLCESSTDVSSFRSELIRRFDIYESIGCDDEGTVLFTAYCSPTYRASRTRRTGFDTPLYGRPAELVTHLETGEPLGRRRDRVRR